MLRSLALAGSLLLACGSDPPPTAMAPTPTSAQPTPAATVVPPTADSAMPATPASVDDPNHLVGLGPIGTLGTGQSTPPAAALGRPSVQMGHPVSTGDYPPEIIQRIVRQNLGRIRLCYENALKKTPTLEGRVSVKYFIDAKGAVKNAADDGSDLQDAATVACIVKAFGDITYPAPIGATVNVKYPILLAPPKP